MRLGGGGYNPLHSDMQATLYEQVQQLRLSDARLRSEAARIQAQAEARGESVATQVGFTRGPDGRNYASSVTITRSRTETTTLGPDGRWQEGEGNGPPRMAFGQPLPQNMADIWPVGLPMTPSEMAESFAQRNREALDGIAEAAALDALQHADAGVRVHEGLHFRAAGGVAQGIAELDFIEGPDGRYYAVAGNVDVQTSTTADPEKAKREAAAFAAAATAPGDASAQDNHAARGAFTHAAETYARVFESRAAPVAAYNMVA